jgi:UDP-glucose 6-dehydrogenase
VSLATSKHFYFLFFTFSQLNAAHKVQRQVTICSSALEACRNADAVIIATEWAEFKTIDWQAVYAGMNKPAFVFDGRLLVNADELRAIGFKVGGFLSGYSPERH